MKKILLISLAVFTASCSQEENVTQEPKEVCNTIVGYSATSCQTADCLSYNYSLLLSDGRLIPYNGNPSNMVGQTYCEIK